MKNKNLSLKERLKNKEFLIGTWCLLPSPDVANILAKSGLDFLLIDFEHGPADFITASRMIMAAEAEGAEAIIRVSSNNEAEILKALEIGASGIIVPHIETPADRKKALSFIKYPPLGQRGFSPYARSGGYALQENHTDRANKKIISGIIIESIEAVNNLDAIIDDPELDVVYIGAYDLSVSLGIPGKVNDEKIIKIITDCAGKINAAGKTAAGLFNTKEDMKFFKSIGINLACYSVDSAIIYKSFQVITKKV
jgi:4-hydroxy-2-oxoheptanedioate aldolase